MAGEHRIELILDKVKTLLLAGPTDAGAKVTRGKNDQHTADDVSASPQLAALNIWQGQDAPEGDGYENIAFQDNVLEVLVDLHRGGVDPVAMPETTLNTLRTQVHKVLMADHTLGLSFVTLIVPGGASEPEAKTDHQFVQHKQRTRWRVFYRTSITDPSA